MKLQTPITVQVHDVEVAVALWHLTNHIPLFIADCKSYGQHEVIQPIGKYLWDHRSIGIDVWSSIDQQLKAAGIAPCEFRPTEEVSKQ